MKSDRLKHSISVHIEATNFITQVAEKALCIAWSATFCHICNTTVLRRNLKQTATVFFKGHYKSSKLGIRRVSFFLYRLSKSDEKFPQTTCTR